MIIEDIDIMISIMQVMISIITEEIIPILRQDIIKSTACPMTGMMIKTITVRSRGIMTDIIDPGRMDMITGITGDTIIRSRDMMTADIIISSQVMDIVKEVMIRFSRDRA